VPYVRTVKTASGATAVQIVYSSHRGSRSIEHIGSAHGDAEFELQKAVGRQKLAAGQGDLDLGLEATDPGRDGAGGGPLPITASRMDCLIGALEHAWRILGLERGQPPDGEVLAIGSGAIAVARRTAARCCRSGSCRRCGRRRG
jgi:hypothetical protein